MRTRTAFGAIGLIFVALISGCRSPIDLSFLPFADPAEAPHGEIAVSHPEGVCALCDLYYGARQTVIQIQAGRTLGAGVIVDARGYAITNAHVVADQTVVLVQTSSGASTAGRIVHTDSTIDLAIVSLAPVDEPWTPMLLQDDAKHKIGSDIYIIGHPVGLGWTVSRGIISGYREAGEIAPIAMIQTDAAISPGNSGGPMVDADGRIVGIVVSKLAGGGAENVAFVIPVAVVREFIAQHVPRAEPSLQP